MPAYLLLLVAILSRLIPHAPWFSFTAVGGSLLYFGARRSWQEMIAPMAALMATDVVLTVAVYHYSFWLPTYLATWLWYAGAMVLGRVLLREKTTVARLASAIVLGPTSFFLVSNFGYWLTTQDYPHTASGLIACYIAALPFYPNDLASTAVVAGLAFGVPALIRRASAAQTVSVSR